MVLLLENQAITAQPQQSNKIVLIQQSDLLFIDLRVSRLGKFGCWLMRQSLN